ncbi:MAG: GGDEF domain-containing protein, partial [Gammaproteobacteria bacterium]|nr:GGDEF domain-containing protein [Gammaproteobacteria bacterium]
MNRLFEFVILTFMVLASLLGLIIFIPGQDILIYGYVAATLVAISVCAVSFSRREIQSLNRQLRERMNSHDRAKGEVARLRAELEKATTKDELTGLHNLDHFKVLLNHERALSERAQYKFTLAMLEIDQYFDIIRNFGNAQANEFLGLSSRVMVAALREVDHVA